MTTDSELLSGLSEAARDGLNLPAADGRTARGAADRMERLGLRAVGVHSDDEEIAQWTENLWDDQDDLLDPLEKQWRKHLHYVAGSQFLVWHNRAGWIKRKSPEWRIQDPYNFTQKALNRRVVRLTEKKPMLSVQAATADRSDVEKAQYKETLFWYLWNELQLHEKVIRARRWAAKCGSGFVKVGWDPRGGDRKPVTRFRPETREVTRRVTDEDGNLERDPETGEPVTTTEENVVGLEEVYVDEEGNTLAPVEVEREHPEDPTRTMTVRRDPPEGTDYFYEGEVFASVLSPFNVRWDPYADSIEESWYVQEAHVLPGRRIVSLWPDALDKLEDARQAGAGDVTDLRQQGLTERDELNLEDVTESSYGGGFGQSEDDDESDLMESKYVVRVTWIWPESEMIEKLWGETGARLVTVGGELVHTSELPKWAREQKPIIQFPSIPEEGNHYSKSFLRDLVPLQDSINRARSHMAEHVMIQSRLLLYARQKANINLETLGALPGALLTGRSREDKPEAIDFGTQTTGADNYYQQTLAAAADIASINDASRGQMPKAGTPAKAIYALQFADERSVAETSNLQDAALQRLAEAIDAVTREKYAEERKIRVVGRDRGFMVEHELRPEHLDIEVDYHFTPGSMLAKQQSAIKNEMFQLLGAGLIDKQTVREHLSTTVPDVFRKVYDTQQAKARRNLNKLIQGEQISPDPWDRAKIHMKVLQEFMDSTRFDSLPEQIQKNIAQAWQAYAQQVKSQQQKQAQAQQQGRRGQGGQGGRPDRNGPRPGEPGRPIGGGGGQGSPISQGLRELAQQAEQGVRPPPGFEEARQGPR